MYSNQTCDNRKTSMNNSLTTKHHYWVIAVASQQLESASDCANDDGVRSNAHQCYLCSFALCWAAILPSPLTGIAKPANLLAYPITLWDRTAAAEGTTRTVAAALINPRLNTSYSMRVMNWMRHLLTAMRYQARIRARSVLAMGANMFARQVVGAASDSSQLCCHPSPPTSPITQKCSAVGTNAIRYIYRCGHKGRKRVRNVRYSHLPYAFIAECVLYYLYVVHEYVESTSTACCWLMCAWYLKCQWVGVFSQRFLRMISILLLAFLAFTVAKFLLLITMMKLRLCECISPLVHRISLWKSNWNELRFWNSIWLWFVVYWYEFSSIGK